MSTIQLIYKGTPVRLYSTFVDPVSQSPPVDIDDITWPTSGSNRHLVDPGAVTVTVKRGDNTILANNVAATRNSQGRYYLDIVVDVAGVVFQTWKVKFVGTAPYSGVVEYTFRVEPTNF